MAKLSGGGHLDWLIPQDGTGNTTRWSEGGHTVVGNLRGNYAGACVANPTPGTVVQWAVKNPLSLVSVRRRG